MRTTMGITSGEHFRVLAIRAVLTGSLLLLLTLAAVGCSPSAQPATAPPATTASTSPVSDQVAPTAPPVPTEPAPATPAQPPAASPAVTEAQPVSPTEPAPEDTPEPESTPVPEDTNTPEPEAAGIGYVIGEGSEVTFTVNEKLAWLDLPNDAVMRSAALSGVIYLDGRPSVIELDLHSLTSDQDRRDGYVRNRMFPDHPVAIFTVTGLGDLPDPLPEGQVINREVPGELAIKDVVKPLVFEVEARNDPDQLFVLGRASFTWQDLELPPPNIPGRIEVKDEVMVQVLLAAVPEAGR